MVGAIFATYHEKMRAFIDSNRYAMDFVPFTVTKKRKSSTLLHFPRPGIDKYIPYCCEPAPALNFGYQKVVLSVKMQVTLSNMG